MRHRKGHTMTELATRDDWTDLQQGRLCRPNSYRSECEEHFTPEHGSGDDSINYGCLETNQWSTDDHTWFEPSYAGGSDYSGGTVMQSNYRVLVRECERLDEERGRKAHEPTFWQTFYGSHGTYAIAFHVTTTPKEVFDMIAGLEEYAIIDEQDMSELECDSENEAWESWGATDFLQALAKHHGLEEDVFEHVTHEQAWSAWNEAADHEGWHAEHDAEGVRFNFSKRVLDRVDLETLLQGAA